MVMCPRCGGQNATYMAVCQSCTQTENLLKGQQSIFSETQRSQYNTIRAAANYSDFDSGDVYTLPSKVGVFLTDLLCFCLVAPVVAYMLWFTYKSFGLFFKLVTFFLPMFN